jgi:hypothetical protein
MQTIGEGDETLEDLAIPSVERIVDTVLRNLG